jgi:hypothetical protein
MYYQCENINIKINININIVWEQLETVMYEDFQLLDPPLWKVYIFPFISFYLLLSTFINFNGESQNSLDTSIYHTTVKIFHHSPVTTQSTVQKDKFYIHRFYNYDPG